MHLFCSECVHIYVCICVCKELTFVFLPGWSGSPMSRDLCRSSSCLKTHSRPTQLHRELSNKYPYWAVHEWEGVQCNDSNILVVSDHLQQLSSWWFNVNAVLSLSVSLCRDGHP